MSVRPLDAVLKSNGIMSPDGEVRNVDKMAQSHTGELVTVTMENIVVYVRDM